MEEPIIYKILEIFSSFANGDRYSNINLLTGNNQQVNPLGQWVDIIDSYIYDNCISEKKKESIRNNAKIISSVGEDLISAFYILETGEPMTNIYGSSMMTGIQTAVAPYRQLYVLKIIRYWVEIINKLQYIAMTINKTEDIPYFNDIFAIFFNSDSYFRSRKTWDI